MSRRRPFRPSRLISVIAGALGASAVVASCGTPPDQPLFSPEQISEAPTFQRELIADGVVTWAEYESAVIAQHECVSAAGYAPGQIEKQGSQLVFDTTMEYGGVADPEAADAKFMDALTKCEDEFITYVGSLWSESLVIDDPAEREKRMAQFASCLRDSGVDVSDDVSLEELASAADASSDADEAKVSACFEEHDQLFYATARQ